MASKLDRIERWEVRGRASNYRVNELAELCQVTPRQLERYFWECFRQSPQDWLLRLAMAEAQRLLTEGMSVADVSQTLRYANTSNFCRAFRKVLGASPTVKASKQAHWGENVAK